MNGNELLEQGLRLDIPLGQIEEELDSPENQSPRCTESDVGTQRELVDRCLAGEGAAWEALFNQCHAPLCASIRSLMGPGCDANVVDEIAARVWHAVVKNDGRLLRRFDPNRHVRLNTYFRGLARVERMLYAREECRHHPPEIDARREHVRDCRPSESQVNAWLSEFAGTLTADERYFLKEYLLSLSNDHADTDCSGSARRHFLQWRHRVMAKLRTFLMEDRTMSGHSWPGGKMSNKAYRGKFPASLRRNSVYQSDRCETLS